MLILMLILILMLTSMLMTLMFFSRADDNLEYNGLDFDGKTENSEFRGGKGERYRWKDLIIDTESLNS